MDLLKVAVTSIVSYVALFFLTLIMGHKQISQLNTFDYITGISIGSIAAELATDIEKPSKPFLAMVIYALAAMLISIITDKSPKLRHLLCGAPSVIMRGGVIYRSKLKKEKLDLNDFLMMCRSAGYFDISAIQIAVYEHNGKVSFLPYADRRPLTPSDMSLKPPDDCLFFEVIQNGFIMEENLKKSGHDINWLKKKLKEQGFGSVRDVFLGICDDKENLMLFKGSD